MRFNPFWSAAFAFGFCYILQAKALGIIGDKKTGMIVPEASHEVKILHNEKTFGLDILEVDPNTELPCDQVHFFKTEPRIYNNDNLSGFQSYSSADSKQETEDHTLVHYPSRGALSVVKLMQIPGFAYFNTTHCCGLGTRRLHGHLEKTWLDWHRS